MFSRRSFLRSSALVALAPTAPGFLARAAHAAGPSRDARVLVVVQLDGGNDGLNTVVPFRDEAYVRARPTLRLPADRILKVTAEAGLHPAMRDAAKLLEDGRLAVVQGVGYPRPSQSHFKSMAIWHSADVRLSGGITDRDAEDADTRAVVGWVGRVTDAAPRPTGGAAGAVYVGRGAVPAALRGRRTTAAAVDRPEDEVLTLRPAAAPAAGPGPGDDLAAFVRRSTLDAYAASERLRGALGADDRADGYPVTGLAGRLRLVARLLKGGAGARVYYTTQPGYDTHYTQAEAHAELLGELSGALRAFDADLTRSGLADRVAVLCFSEFGRRAAENGSRGTDHGSAGPVLVVGRGVRGGLVGTAPSPADLDENGNLKMGIDFRRVYATVLDDWLGIGSGEVLGGTFDKLPLFRA